MVVPIEAVKRARFGAVLLDAAGMAERPPILKTIVAIRWLLPQIR
jgi:hypothetical protein